MSSISLSCSTLTDRLHAAMVLEAAARKAGNVHPQASFDDLRFEDFIRSAEVSAPLLAGATTQNLGSVIRDAVSAVKGTVQTNSNLGIVLLLAPLATVAESDAPASALAEWLPQIDLPQTALVYEAIRMAQPGGMGTVSHQDVSQRPSTGLQAAMRLAAERDLIARQYDNHFADVLDSGRSDFLNWSTRVVNWERAVVGTQLSLMSRLPDTLIARKCGRETAEEAQHQATEILDLGWPDSTASQEKFAEFDHWLRSDGHRRNPGSIADLLAAVLFAAMQWDAWGPPSTIEW